MPSPKDTQLQTQKAPLSQATNHEVVKKSFTDEIKDITEQLKLPDSLAKRVLAAASTVVQLKKDFEKLIIQKNQLQHFIKDSASAIKSETREKNAAAFDSWRNSANKLAIKSAQKRQVNNTSMMDLSTQADALENRGAALGSMIDVLMDDYLSTMQKEHDDYQIGHENLCAKLASKQSALQQNFEEKVAKIDRETPEGKIQYHDLCQQHEQDKQALHEKYHGRCGKLARLAEDRDANLEKLQAAHHEKITPLHKELDGIRKDVQQIKELVLNHAKPENTNTNDIKPHASHSPFAQLAVTPTLVRK